MKKFIQAALEKHQAIFKNCDKEGAFSLGYECAIADAAKELSAAPKEPASVPYGYVVEANDGHKTFFDTDPNGFRHPSYKGLVKVHTLYAAPSPTEQASDVRNANNDLLTYVLQDDIHNRLTPRVIDIAYTAFMCAKQPNDEDGGASDWFNDTKPVVMKAIDKLRKDLSAPAAKCNAPDEAILSGANRTTSGAIGQP